MTTIIDHLLHLIFRLVYRIRIQHEEIRPYNRLWSVEVTISGNSRLGYWMVKQEHRFRREFPMILWHAGGISRRFEAKSGLGKGYCVSGDVVEDGVSLIDGHPVVRVRYDCVPVR